MSAEEVKEMLEPLIQQAEREGMWLYHNGIATGEFWFSPTQLRAENEKGHFLWGPVNWQLRDPWDKIKMLDQRISELMQERDNMLRNIGISQTRLEHARRSQ